MDWPLSENLEDTVIHDVTKHSSQFVLLKDNKKEALQLLTQPIVDKLVIVNISSVSTLTDILHQSSVTNLISNVWVIVGMDMMSIQDFLERFEKDQAIKLSINTQLYFLTNMDNATIVQVEGNVYQAPKLLVSLLNCVCNIYP